jgi:hypothetical protein
VTDRPPARGHPRSGTQQAEPQPRGLVGEQVLIAVPVEVARTDQPLEPFRLQPLAGRPAASALLSPGL